MCFRVLFHELFLDAGRESVATNTRVPIETIVKHRDSRIFLGEVRGWVATNTRVTIGIIVEYRDTRIFFGYRVCLDYHELFCCLLGVSFLATSN